MPDVDLFELFRWFLGILVTVYATLVTLQWLWSWYVWLRGEEKYVPLLRRYLLVQGLRLRLKKFRGDVTVCLLLCVAFVIMWWLHGLIEQRRL